MNTFNDQGFVDALTANGWESRLNTVWHRPASSPLYRHCIDLSLGRIYSLKKDDATHYNGCPIDWDPDSKLLRVGQVHELKTWGKLSVVIRPLR